jgi:ABC-type nickel/cobalt efflux system permease component RcnA
MIIYFLTGLAASSLHVVSGPDHLAAITPLAIENRKKSWLVGFTWGLGHTIGVGIIGLLFILFRDLIPVETISAYSEQIVGVLLIVIGLWIFYRIFTNKPHRKIETKKDDVWTALGIGVIHGVAGVSHLIGILPSLALPTRADSISYVLGFGIGTVLTMVAYSAIMGMLSQRAAKKNHKKLLLGIRIAGSSIAVLVGIFWIIQASLH